MVIPTCRPVPHQHRNATVLGRGQWPARRAASGRRCVDVDIQHLVDCLRAHVPHTGSNVARKFPFHREVPRLYVAAMQRAAPRASRTHIHGWRQFDHSRAGVRNRNRRDPLVESIDPGVRSGGHERRSDRGWIHPPADARRQPGSYVYAHSRCAPPYFPRQPVGEARSGRTASYWSVIPTFFGLLPTPPIYTRLVPGSHRSMPRSALEISG